MPPETLGSKRFVHEVEVSVTILKIDDIGAEAIVLVLSSALLFQVSHVTQAKSAQKELGQGVRKMLESKGIISVAAAGYQVVVVTVVALTIIGALKTKK